MIDLEAVPGRSGAQPLLVQAGDDRSRRPLPHAGLERLDSLGLAGDLDLDAAVPQVAHAAGQAQLAGHAAHEPAEADALDAPAQPQPQGHPLAPAAAEIAARHATGTSIPAAPVTTTAAIAAIGGAAPARTTAAAAIPVPRAAAAHLPPSFQPWRPTSGTKPTSSPSLRRSSPRADLR